VKDVAQLLKASPKDWRSRESWMSWLGNVESDDAEVDLDAFPKLLRGCPKNVPMRIPLHPTARL
jgi:hypothetical protein